MAVDLIFYKKIGMLGKQLGFRQKNFAICQADKGNDPSRKILIRTSAMFAGLFLCILMFELLTDWIVGFFHFVFELLHLIFELAEYCLEFILANTLQTDHRQSEIIIANGAIIVGLFCVCYLFIVAPGLYTRIKKKLPLLCV